MDSVAEILMLVVVTACGVTDVLRHRIYNAVTYPALGVALAVHGTGAGGLDMDLASAAMGAVAGFVPLFLLYLMGGVGGGDAKLMAVIGAFKGTFFVLGTLFWSLVMGSVFGLVTAAFTGELRGILKRVFYTLFHTAMPGMGVTNHLDPEGLRINFGAAICVATWIALLSESWTLSLFD